MKDDLLQEDPAGDRARPRPGALAVLATAQLVLALDYSIVNVALPSIGAALGFSRDAVEWVVSAYALMFGGFLLLGGRSSDPLGRRHVFVAAGTLFGLASMCTEEGSFPARSLLSLSGTSASIPARMSWRCMWPLSGARSGPTWLRRCVVLATVSWCQEKR